MSESVVASCLACAARYRPTLAYPYISIHIRTNCIIGQAKYCSTLDFVALELALVIVNFARLLRQLVLLLLVAVQLIMKCKQLAAYGVEWGSGSP